MRRQSVMGRLLLFVGWSMLACASIAVADGVQRPPDARLYELVLSYFKNETPVPVLGVVLPIGVEEETQEHRYLTEQEAGTRLTGERRQVLDRLGLKEGETSIPSRCGSILMHETEGCPKESVLRVSSSLPMEGGAFYPDVVDERDIGKRRGWWKVRVAALDLGPRGHASELYDAVFELRDDRWILREMRPLIAFD